jgi:4,5-dihydroxyphthalate decarboxylase
MSGTKLKTVTRTQGNNRALKEGTVQPQGYELEFEEVPVLIDAFRRMVRGLEYDVSEMALTTYICAREQGKQFTAIPVFLVRAFHHGAIVVRRGGEIRTPADLAGKKVGVARGYTVTGGLWARTVMQEEYGVDLSGVTWVLSGDEHVAEYRPPANVVPKPGGRTLQERLLAGEIAAMIGGDADHPDLVQLIPQSAEAGLDALRTRGHYPINHLIVIRNSVLEQNPGVAVAVFNAFAESKRIYLENLKNGTLGEETAVDRTHRRVAEIIGDPLPYGIETNRRTLEAIIEHCLTQGVITRRVTVDELFAPATRSLVG